MASPITLRLDAETRRRVQRIAKRRRMTTSAALREAIGTWVSRAEEESKVSVYDSIKDLIGSVHGGDPERSTRGGRWIAQMLKERRERQ